ncbi:hypothetical protein Ancab_008728 [Ancistrocladus abbreviatus]
MMPNTAISSNEVQLFQCLGGIRQLAETQHFKLAWLLDQFRVLHDGKQPYPAAISTLEKLAATGAQMVVISNSSRRSSVTVDKLRSLGFDPSLFVGAITSGELTHQYLQKRADDWFAALGRSCIHITWSDRGAISLEVAVLFPEVAFYRGVIHITYVVIDERTITFVSFLIT